MQLESIDMQNDDLQNKFNEDNLLSFNRWVHKTAYKELLVNTLKCASLFGSTYICEKTFSVMNLDKTKDRVVRSMPFYPSK